MSLRVPDVEQLAGLGHVTRDAVTEGDANLGPILKSDANCDANRLSELVEQIRLNIHEVQFKKLLAFAFLHFCVGAPTLCGQNEIKISLNIIFKDPEK